MCEQIDDTDIADSIPTMDKAARYRIQVVGKLDPSWSDRLGGLQIAVTGQAGKRTITTLSGLLIDQCALAGVLITLHDLQLPILSLTYLKEKGGQEGWN